MNTKETKNIENRLTGVEAAISDLRNDFKELVAFVSERFDKLVDLISGMRANIDYLKENMVTRTAVEEIVERVSEGKKNEILGIVDAYAKQSDDRQQEHDILVGQVDRHERWVDKIAKKTNVKLDY